MSEHVRATRPSERPGSHVLDVSMAWIDMTARTARI
jgi:hypothetical protein